MTKRYRNFFYFLWRKSRTLKFILYKEKNSYSLVKRDFWDRLVITGFQATRHPDLGEDGKPVEADEKLMGAKRKAGKGRSATVMGLVVIILQYWSSNLEDRFWTIPELVMTYPFPLLFEWITNFQFLLCQWCNVIEMFGTSPSKIRNMNKNWKFVIRATKRQDGIYNTWWQLTPTSVIFLGWRNRSRLFTVGINPKVSTWCWIQRY